MRRVALFPATFDPPTLGHMETIARSAAVFDEIVVAVYAEPAKATLFTSRPPFWNWVCRTCVSGRTRHN